MVHSIVLPVGSDGGYGLLADTPRGLYGLVHFGLDADVALAARLALPLRRFALSTNKAIVQTNKRHQKLAYTVLLRTLCFFYFSKTIN